MRKRFSACSCAIVCLPEVVAPRDPAGVDSNTRAGGNRLHRTGGPGVSALRAELTPAFAGGGNNGPRGHGVSAGPARQAVVRRAGADVRANRGHALVWARP